VLFTEQTAREKIMNTFIESEIQSAIDRSISHDENVHLEIDGSFDDVMVAIDSLADCEFDYAMISKNVIDIWGFDEDAKNGEMIWRLCISLCAE